MELNATVGTGSVAHGLLRRIVVWCVVVKGGLAVGVWADSPFTRWRSSCQVAENVSSLYRGKTQECLLFIEIESGQMDLIFVSNNNKKIT